VAERERKERECRERLRLARSFFYKKDKLFLDTGMMILVTKCLFPPVIKSSAFSASCFQS